MSEHNIEPLAPDLLALLGDEKRAPAPPPDVQGRLLSRIGWTLGLPGGPGGPGASAPAGGPSGSSVAAGASGAAGHVARSVGLFGSSLKVGVAAFALGTAAGAGIYSAVERREAPRVEVMAAAPAVELIAPLPSAPPVAEPAAQALPPAAKVRHAAPSNPPKPETATIGRDTDLAAERALVEMARTALSRGQSAAALAALEKHGQQFPEGQLAEEREALSVQALVGAGEYQAARARGDGFRARFPRSLLLPVVDAALQSIP